MTNTIPFSLVFLSGGVGTRMGKDVPKQYLTLDQKLLALHSFEVFIAMPEIQDIVVVCEKKYEKVYLHAALGREVRLSFAHPGNRRQDSVSNGIRLLQDNPLVCIHDSARPFIEEELIREVVQEALSWEAAVAGVKVKSTIKICDGAQIVVETPSRGCLWEIQTPQVIRLNLLLEGFAYADEHDITVSDDVSLVELMGKPVKVVEGSYANIKITTPEDLILAEQFLGKNVLLQTHSRL